MYELRLCVSCFVIICVMRQDYKLFEGVNTPDGLMAYEGPIFQVRIIYPVRRGRGMCHIAIIVAWAQSKLDYYIIHLPNRVIGTNKSVALCDTTAEAVMHHSALAHVRCFCLQRAIMCFLVETEQSIRETIQSPGPCLKYIGEHCLFLIQHRN